MSLETGTYVSDLVVTNPPGSDKRYQGDDHIRLIKSLLRATFPNADRAWRMPEVVAAKTGAYNVLAADDNKIIPCDAASIGAFTVTLPAVADVPDGFAITLYKSDAGTNAVLIDGNGAETIDGEASISLEVSFATAILISTGAAWKLVGGTRILRLAPPAPGVLWGMQISNAADTANDLTISAGSCADATNKVTITLTSAITKRLDAAWSAGDAQGGLDTGSIANTTYHIFAIYRSDTGVSDVLFSASLASPTMPSGYTHKRRILSLQRTGGAWQSIYQHGDYVLLKTPVADSSAALTTTVGDITLASVPNGIVVMAHLAISLADASIISLATIHSKLGNDMGPSGSYGTVGVSATGATATQIHGTQFVLTNSAQTIRADAQANLDATAVNTLGWYDYRGRQF